MQQLSPLQHEAAESTTARRFLSSGTVRRVSGADWGEVVMDSMLVMRCATGLGTHAIVSRISTSRSNVVRGLRIAKRVFGRPACELGTTNAR